MKKVCSIWFVILLGISACSQPVQAARAPLATALSVATSTPIPAYTETPFSTPIAALDPTVFGALGAHEIQAQAQAIESVADAIFKKTMDSFVAGGRISEYQVTHITVLPGEADLLAEITYNVKTSDTSWLADGGIQAADGWIKGDCARFDFVITETEFQLTNRRACG